MLKSNKEGEMENALEQIRSGLSDMEKGSDIMIRNASVVPDDVASRLFVIGKKMVEAFSRGEGKPE